MTVSAGNPPEQALSNVSRWLVLAGLWLVYFCFGLTVASMAPLVGPISAELQVSNTAMGAIFGAWPLTYIVAAIPCGMLLDRLGARRMLFLAALVMAASSVARGLAESPTQLLLAVALFGIGGPMISVGAPTVVTRLFQGKQRATAMGIYVTGPYLGGLIALSLTNSLVLPAVGGDWRGVMFVNAGLVTVSGVIWLILATALAPRRKPGAEEPAKKFNLSAFAQILHLAEVRLILLMSVGIFFINHGLNNWLPEILRAKGLSAVDAGYWAAIPSSVGILGALMIPRLATPERRLLVMSLLFGSALVASLLLQTGFGPLLVSGLVLQGMARGAMMTVAILILMETPHLPQKSLGLAGGLFFTTAEIGGVLGPLTFGFLSDLSGGFRVPLGALTLICLGLFLLLWLYARAAAKARADGGGATGETGG